MAETVPADFIEQPETGYLFLALLSENAQNYIANLLHDLGHELPGVIWPMPPQALHITLCEIVQARKTYSQDKDSLYEEHRAVYEYTPKQILADIKCFDVTFDAIEASEQAIIVKGKDNGQFRTIRANFVSHLPLPTETKVPPDIIHSSIARYIKAVDLAQVQEVICRHTVSFTESITEFQLLKTLVPPLLRYAHLRTYALKN